MDKMHNQHLYVFIEKQILSYISGFIFLQKYLVFAFFCKDALFDFRATKFIIFLLYLLYFFRVIFLIIVHLDIRQ